MREAIGIKRLQAPKTQSSTEVPPWLRVMYTTNYFGICMAHADSKKNELEQYFCIDCKRSFCCNCLSAHALHKYIKIRRYVYCEVIKRQDISKFFDCSGIQAYHTNKSKVLFLKQRSHQQPMQQTLKDHNCIVCGRSLQDASFYCSIACKVSAICKGEYDQETTHVCKKVNTGKNKGSENGDKEDLPLLSPKRFKSRKGVAFRAPLF